MRGIPNDFQMEKKMSIFPFIDLRKKSIFVLVGFLVKRIMCDWNYLSVDIFCRNAYYLFRVVHVCCINIFGQRIDWKWTISPHYCGIVKLCGVHFFFILLIHFYVYIHVTIISQFHKLKNQNIVMISRFV